MVKILLTIVVIFAGGLVLYLFMHKQRVESGQDGLPYGQEIFVFIDRLLNTNLTPVPPAQIQPAHAAVGSQKPPIAAEAPPQPDIEVLPSVQGQQQPPPPDVIDDAPLPPLPPPQPPQPPQPAVRREFDNPFPDYSPDIPAATLTSPDRQMVSVQCLCIIVWAGGVELITVFSARDLQALDSRLLQSIIGLGTGALL